MNVVAAQARHCSTHRQAEHRSKIIAFSSENFDRPILLGKDLENRIATFVLAHGAVSARFEIIGGMPTLICFSADGIEHRTSLGGTAAGWHAALDEMADLYDEDVDAGLRRTLRAAETRSPIEANDNADSVKRPALRAA